MDCRGRFEDTFQGVLLSWLFELAAVLFMLIHCCGAGSGLKPLATISLERN